MSHREHRTAAAPLARDGDPGEGSCNPEQAGETDLAEIKGILFDKDGTLVDFEQTWFALADLMALHAADNDRPRADALLAIAGYDFANKCFKADSVFAAGTNAEIVAIWYPDAGAERRAEMIQFFDTFTAEQGAPSRCRCPAAARRSPSFIAPASAWAWRPTIRRAARRRRCLALGIAQMFEAAYGYDAVANPKPAPDTLIAFCDLTGLKPAEIAMVGDNRHDLRNGQGERGRAGRRRPPSSGHRHPPVAGAAGGRRAGPRSWTRRVISPPVGSVRLGKRERAAFPGMVGASKTADITVSAAACQTVPLQRGMP